MSNQPQNHDTMIYGTDNTIAGNRVLERAMKEVTYIIDDRCADMSNEEHAGFLRALSDWALLHAELVEYETDALLASYSDND